MDDKQFDALCEANSFGAVARGEFPLVPRAMLKGLVDAAVAAERERCAKVCDALAKVMTPDRRSVAEDLARAIREDQP